MVDSILPPQDYVLRTKGLGNYVLYSVQRTE